MDSLNDQGATTACCIDCRWREIRGEIYGATSHWCALLDRRVDSSRVLGQACDRFEHWRDAA